MKPCYYLQKHMLERHQQSKMNLEAQFIEHTRQSAQHHGGIQKAFTSRIKLQRKAVVGALKVVYWLAKEELAHTTKYVSLIDLAKSLGCDYL